MARELESQPGGSTWKVNLEDDLNDGIEYGLKGAEKKSSNGENSKDAKADKPSGKQPSKKSGGKAKAKTGEK